MTGRGKYSDPWEDPNADPEDIKYGDYDSEFGDGFSIVGFDSPEDYDDDDEV